jgi:hypothetical protein
MRTVRRPAQPIIPVTIPKDEANSPEPEQVADKRPAAR